MLTRALISKVRPFVNATRYSPGLANASGWTDRATEWEAPFELPTPLVYGLARLVVFAFRRWMKKNLERIEAELELRARANRKNGDAERVRS